MTVGAGCPSTVACQPGSYEALEDDRGAAVRLHHGAGGAVRQVGVLDDHVARRPLQRVAAAGGRGGPACR